MLALVDTLSAKECTLLLGRMKATIAGALIVRASGHDLLTALEKLAGNDCHGPTLSGDAPKELLEARKALTDWAFGTASADTVLERLAKTLV